MSKRASIFAGDTDLDVSGFAPKTKTESSAPAAEQVRAVSQSANFNSREPQAPKIEAPSKPEAAPKRTARRYRTGRNVQFNVKARAETLDVIYGIAEAQGWVLGYTLQRAAEALQRELKQPK
jgi:hypothetical protein